MALDSLQAPATIINNDRLISMAGNLMAKKKADKDAYSKSLIDQMAKIDSAGIKREDIGDFNKKYNDYVSFGSANINNLDNPEVQVKLKQMENDVRGFINLSKLNKEEDVKLVAYTSPDFDDNTRNSAQTFINTKTLDRKGSFDYTKAAKIDKEDYLSKWKIDPKEVVMIGDTKYMNPASAYPLILNNIKENVRAKINTLDGAKGLAQYAASKGLDLAVPEKKEEAINGLAQTLFDINKINFDKAISEKTPKSETEGSIKRGEKAVKVKSYFGRIWSALQGDPNFIDYVKSQAPAGLEVGFDGNTYTFKRQRVDNNNNPVYMDSAGNIGAQFSKTGKPVMDDEYSPVSKSKGTTSFLTNMANTLSDFGKKSGQEFIPTSDVLDYYNSNYLGKNAQPIKKGAAKKPANKPANKPAAKPKSGAPGDGEM
jgi:hypothetical protein